MCRPAGNELRYYFTVNNRYVRNKLRMLLFPFSVRGQWHRALDQVGVAAWLAAHSWSLT